MPTTPDFTPARPGTAAARWRGPLVLAPLVVVLHAAVLFSAWQVVDRKPALQQDAARDADTALRVQPRDLRLLPQAPTAMAMAAAADSPARASASVSAPATAAVSAPVRAPVRAPVTAPVTVPVSASAQTTRTSTAPAARSEVALLADLVEAATAPPEAGEHSPMAAALAQATAPAAIATLTVPAAPAAPAAPSLETTPATMALADDAMSLAADPAPQVRLPPMAADALAAAAAPPAPPPPAAATGSVSVSLPSLPVYRGEPPPPATLHFTLRRAAVSGRGQLSWKPSAQGYELTLQGTVLGLRALEQTSRGRLDQGSLAPDRFLDSRRGRAARAANFRRDVGLISYSAVEQTYPLVRGAQDRLSWMLQLPAVMQANPALRQVGTELHMFVTGARGDGAVWGFRVMSVDRITVPAGEVPRALHLQRLPRHEHDTQADIWLDPGQHHLPARVRLQSGDDVLDLVLERLEQG